MVGRRACRRIAQGSHAAPRPGMAPGGVPWLPTARQQAAAITCVTLGYWTDRRRRVDDRYPSDRVELDRMSHLEPLDPQSLEVKVSELLVATADGHDPDLDRAISEVLLLLRRQLRMDVVFVSEFVDGERVFRFMRGGEVLGLHEGDSAPLEASYCHQVVTGRMPELVPDAAALVASGELPDSGLPIGAHLSTPVVLPDGRVYGTVCCFSTAAKPDLQHSALACLRQCARLVARKVEVAPHAGFAPTEPAPFPEITGQG